VTLRREARDHIEADNEQVHRRERERILKEMDALEQVPLVSPYTADCVLQIAWQSNTVSPRSQIFFP
jgi:endonuclease III